VTAGGNIGAGVQGKNRTRSWASLPGSTAPPTSGIHRPTPQCTNTGNVRLNWSRPRALFCYPLDLEHLPDEPEIVERVRLRSCRNRAAAIDLILDGRPGEEQCHGWSI
jgi:hypothetical protein